MPSSINSMNQTVNISSTTQPVKVSGMNNVVNILNLQHGISVSGMNNVIVIQLMSANVSISGCNNIIKIQQQQSGTVSNSGMNNQVQNLRNNSSQARGSQAPPPQFNTANSGRNNLPAQQNLNAQSQNSQPNRAQQNYARFLQDSEDEESSEISCDYDGGMDEEDHAFLMGNNYRSHVQPSNIRVQSYGEQVFSGNQFGNMIPNMNIMINGIGNSMQQIFGPNGVFTQQMRNMNRQIAQSQQQQRAQGVQNNFSFTINGQPVNMQNPEPPAQFIEESFGDDVSKDVPAGSDPESVIDCCICMEKFSKKSPNCAYLECAHFFHNRCIQNWFIVKKECPSCRHESESIFLPNR